MTFSYFEASHFLIYLGLIVTYFSADIVNISEKLCAVKEKLYI